MDEQSPLASLHLVLLNLAGVVGHVVEEIESGPGQNLGERLARQVGEDLAVGQRAVDARAHGPQVALTDRGVDGGAGELPVRQPDAVRARREEHTLEELGADLVAQARFWGATGQSPNRAIRPLPQS